MNVKGILIILIIILLGGNLFFGFQFYKAKAELAEIKTELREREVNDKALEFLKMFVDKVLKSEGEVTFEDRLTLENAIRQLDSPEIVNQWKKFTDSQTEIEAQVEVRNLIEMLVNKIK